MSISVRGWVATIGRKLFFLGSKVNGIRRQGISNGKARLLETRIEGARGVTCSTGKFLSFPLSTERSKEAG